MEHGSQSVFDVTGFFIDRRGLFPECEFSPTILGNSKPEVISCVTLSAIRDFLLSRKPGNNFPRVGKDELIPLRNKDFNAWRR